MTQSDDKNRTMSFIDVLKADKEERERAAMDKSIEYTEVLEIDPELAGGTKPPKLRMAPLYEDVDEPVKTPFDDLDVSREAEESTGHFEKPEETSDNVGNAYLGETPSAAPKFELPDFLRKAVGFGAGKDEVVEVERESKEMLHDEKPEAGVEGPAVEETVAEEIIAETAAEEAVAEEIIAEAAAEEAVAEEIISEAAAEEAVAEVIEAETAAEEAAAEEIVAETAAVETALEETQNEELVDGNLNSEDTENAYLDEDLYHELSEEPRSSRISRIVAHADEYDAEDEEEAEISEDDSQIDADEPIDEKELFSEMTEPGHKATGMTIAAPADEEAEIEALKRRLAELTGTVEIDPELLAGAETEQQSEAAAEPAAEAVAEHIEESVLAAPEEESEEAEEGSFEALGADFAFEPEITEADNEMFAGLAAANEPVAEPVTEPVAEPKAEPKFEDFIFEPEVTEADNEMFAGLTAASEPSFKEPVVDPVSEPVIDTPVIDLNSEPAEPTPAVEPISEPAAPAPVIEPLNETAPKTSFGLSVDDELIANEPQSTAEVSAVEAAFGLSADTEPVAAEPVETPKAEEMEASVEELLAKYVPQYFGDKAAETPAAEPAPEVLTEPASIETPAPAVAAESVVTETPAPAVTAEPAPAAVTEPVVTEAPALDAFIKDRVDDGSPIVGFAPAVTEQPKAAAQEAAPATGRATISLDDFIKDDTEQVKPVEAAPAVEIAPSTEAAFVAESAPIAETTPVTQEPKPTDAVSLEDLEKDLFGSAANEDAEAETTKKIDKFYTLYRKNEEFQRLLDEEYSRLKGDNIVIPEDETPATGLGADPVAASEVTTAAAGEASQTTVGASEPAKTDFSAGIALEDLTADSRPVEDATIYRVDMPEDLAKIAENSEDNSGFSVGGEEAKGFGLGGAETTEAVATAAGTAVAGAAALTKTEKKAAKKAEKKRKKEEAAAAQVEYEEVDSGSTVLTILAVIVAILLVLLLAVILILHVAPGSGIAMAIDEFIENMTARFSVLNTFGGQKLL